MSPWMVEFDQCLTCSIQATLLYEIELMLEQYVRFIIVIAYHDCRSAHGGLGVRGRSNFKPLQTSPGWLGLFSLLLHI